MSSVDSNSVHILELRKKIKLQKQALINRAKKYQVRTVNRALLVNVLFEHKKSLKRLERALQEKKVDLERSRVTLSNSRRINIYRYLKDFQAVCATGINCNSTIYTPEDITDISSLLEGFFWHQNTLDVLEKIEEYQDESISKEPISIASGESELGTTVSTSERAGESGRTTQHEIPGPSANI